MLLQKLDDNLDKSIGYLSKILDNQEQNSDTTHRKFLAVVRAILLPSLFLKGTNATVLTGHHALYWIFNFVYGIGEFMGGRRRFMEYDFDIIR